MIHFDGMAHFDTHRNYSDCLFLAMKDGLYRVRTNYLCADFIIENNKPTICTLILRKKFNYWKTIAIWIGD